MTIAEEMTPDEALALFGSETTLPEARRFVLTAMISAKLLQSRTDDAGIRAGRSLILRDATVASNPLHRLLAIAEIVRMAQVVKKWAPEIPSQLESAFASEIPSIRLLTDADDRLNVARACSMMSAAWIPAYLARAIADEDTGEKARAEMIAGLFAKSANIADALQQLGSAFEALRPTTEAPGDTVAKRLTRTLSALRDYLLESEQETGPELGKSLSSLVSSPLSTKEIGCPQDEKVQLDLTREALLTVHDVLRTRVSVITDPAIYGLVAYCKRFFGKTWPVELKKPLERLTKDVAEALLLLGRQEKFDKTLLDQLEVLSSSRERARAIAKELSIRNPDLPENVRFWLENGRPKRTRPPSNTAIETYASRSDMGIGQALQLAKKTRNRQDNLRDRILSILEVFEPTLVSPTKDLLNQAQSLAVQVEQIATLRGLRLYGEVGEEVEMATKFFDIEGRSVEKQMTVKESAVVRIRDDGAIGDVVVKGLLR